MFKRMVIVATAALATSVFAVSEAAADDPAYGGTAVKSVTASLVNGSGAAIGTVQLHQDAAGVVLVRIDAAGLPAGAHGVHIHAVGKCEGPDFASAGGHFNPAERKHGLASADGPHAGDLAQIPASFDGSGVHTATTNRISLTTGATNIEDADGSALVIHASADDQATDPTGNSGARIACAVIAAPRPAAPAPPKTGSGYELTADSNSWAIPAGAIVAAFGLLALFTPVLKRSTYRGNRA